MSFFCECSFSAFSVALERLNTARLLTATKTLQHRGRGEELTESTEKELRAWFFLCALCKPFSVRSVFPFL